MTDAKPLIVIQSDAYAGSTARGALDIAMSYAVFAQDPSILFLGSGVTCLVEKQDAEKIGRKSLRKVIESFPLYDIENVYVDAGSLSSAGIGPERLPSFAKILDASQQKALEREASFVVSL